MAIAPPAETLARLAFAYPDAHCELNFTNPFELLVATILSAQCTDKQVNKATVKLFQHYSDPLSFANADPKDLQKFIYPTGFYRNKTKALIGLGKTLLVKHAGEVPQTLKELVQLPGVGRKTANVVLGNAFNIPGLTIDTHFMRLSHRWEWSKSNNPEVIEMDISKIVPKSEWVAVSHRVIWHGRRICKARKPACDICFLQDICPSALKWS